MIIYHLSNIIISILFFYLTHFRELGQKYKDIFVRFLVQIKTSIFDFEIYWPLYSYIENIINCVMWVILFLLNLTKNNTLLPDLRIYIKLRLRRIWHIGRYDSNFSHISISFSKFGLPYEDGPRAVMGVKW